MKNRFRKILSVLLVALTLALSMPFSAFAGNETSGGATTISLNKRVTDTFVKGSKTIYERWYKFTVTKPGYITVNIYSEGFDEAWINIYDNNLNKLWSDWVWVSDDPCNIYLNKGTYYMCCGPDYLEDDGTYSYFFSLKFTELEDTYPTSYGKVVANDASTIETAPVLEVGKTVYGVTYQNQLYDYYKFVLPSSSEVCFDIKGNIDEAALLNQRGEQIGCCYDSRSLFLSAGTYYLKMYESHPLWVSPTTYTLKYNKCTPVKDDLPETIDKTHNSLFDAAEIKFGKTYNTIFSPNDGIDFYTFEVPKNMRANLVFNRNGNWNGYFIISIYNDLAELIYSTNDEDDEDEDDEDDYDEVYYSNNYFDKLIDLSKGSYYISFYSSSEYYYGETYSFSISEYKLNEPVISSISNTSSGISLKWNSIARAKGYSVYRKEGTGSYKKLADTTATSYVDKSVKPGVTYTYCIKAYNDNISSTYKNKTKTLKRLPATEISSITPGASSNKLVWKKAPEATGYYVYRKTGSGSYSLIKTITKNSTVSYSDTTVKNGQKYTYYVQTFYKTSEGVIYKGVKSATKTGYYVAPISLGTIANGSKGSTTVKFKTKNTGADKYQIQYSTSSKFSSPKTITVSSGSSSAKITGLKSGKTYYFRARAVKSGSYYSQWSKAVKKVYLEKCSISELTNPSAGTAKLKLKASVSGADKYEIQYSKSSNFKSYKTVTFDGSKTTKTFSLPKGTYYVRVRAMKTVSNVTYYGANSTYMKLKVTK